ncbi:hypothetical protein [Microbacterium sp.]|uniref:hypothetical protein n=1 Tax=Microbacterium sp. TaxID=51671 RepID=UPI00373525D9
MEDQVSTKAAKAAASVMLLDKSLDGLSGRAVVAGRASASLGRDLDGVPRSASAADRSINQLTGRLAVFRDLALTLGPALNPVGGVLSAGVGGLANQLSVAALAGGSMVAAFQGVGDALEAVNTAALEPTTDNLAEAEAAMERLSPAAREAVRALSALRPTLTAIRDAGAEGLFPGLTAALDSLEDRAPDVARIVQALNETTGTLLAQGAGALQSTEWDDFFDFLATDARDTLEDLGRSVGFVAAGLADMWMAFDPLSDDFSSWALNASRDFAEWADALGETEGFSEFVAYVRETGPQVADTFSAMGDALLQIVQATAPLGGPALAALEAVSKVVASIADSDLGTPFFVGMAAVAAYNRVLSITAGLQARVGGSQMLSGLAGPKGLSSARESLAGVRADVEALGATWATAGARTSREQARIAASTKSLKSNLAGVAKGAAPAAAGIAGLTLASTGAADGLGLTNTVSLALMGTLAGPWGAAVGASVGALMDMGKASGDAFDALDRLGETLRRMPVNATAADFEFLNARMTEATEKVERLQEMRDNPFSSVGNFLGSIKNDIEDTFGASDIEEAERQLAEYEKQAASAKWESEGLSGTLGTLESRTAALAATTQAEADALRESVDAMREKRSEAIRAFNAETNYHAALDDATQSLKDNGRTLDITTEKGRANRTALAGIAAAWNDLSDAEKNAAGGSRQARKAFIDTAESMGMTREEARKLARQLFEIPTKRMTDVGIKGQDSVIAQARAIRAELDAATRDRHVNVTVSMPVLPSDRKIHGGATRNADGGTVPRTGLPYADRHHYLLADGEEVISNRYGQADRWRPFLKAINANRLADGGTAGGDGRFMTNGLELMSRGNSPTRQFEKAIDRLTGKLNKATSSLEDWRSKMEAAGQAATAQFAPDLFGNGGAWSKGSGPIGALRDATAGINQRGQLLEQLKKAGVKGEALTALMAGSNTDITALLASGDAGQYQKAYDAYMKAQTRVANQAGQVAYGAQEAAAEKRVERLEKQLKALRREQREAARSRKRWEDKNDDIAKGVSKPAGRGAANGRRKAATRR